MSDQTCVYTEAWVGECGERAVTSDPPLCSEHRGETCWCGEQAVRECPFTGQFVCGRPLCESHECNRTGMLFAGGKQPHSEKGREQYERYTND